MLRKTAATIPLKYIINIQSTWLFRQRQFISSSYFAWLNFEKHNTMINIFLTNQKTSVLLNVIMITLLDTIMLNMSILLLVPAENNTMHSLRSGYEYEDVKAELMLNVDKIIEWFQDNHMKVNPDKFQCIVFGKVVNPDNFLINGNVVRPEERVKLLGVHIENKLNFGHHVSHICQKAGKQVKVLGRLSRVFN